MRLWQIRRYKDKETNACSGEPSWSSTVGWASSRAPRGGKFNSQLGNIQEATGQCFSLILINLSFPFSKYVLRWQFLKIFRRLGDLCKLLRCREKQERHHGMMGQSSDEVSPKGCHYQKFLFCSLGAFPMEFLQREKNDTLTGGVGKEQAIENTNYRPR